MNETEYEQFKSGLFDRLANEFDRVCEHRLKDIAARLSNEQPPYPPKHTVTLARAVHALAMRTLTDEHPSKRPGSKNYMSDGRHGLHRYWVTVARLNDGINREAKSGNLRLRDRLTGLPIREWEMPSTEQCKSWERAAIFPNDDRKAADRRAIEIMDTFNWPLLAPHFDESVVVSLAELDAWAADLGIVEAGGMSALLQAAAKAADVACITDAGLEADPLPDVCTALDPDEKLAALFDPVTVGELETMFRAGDAQWAKWAGRAYRNGLDQARQGRGKYNPYRAAMWFLRQGVPGWDMARCYRTLLKNLPARSKDYEYLLGGE